MESLCFSSLSPDFWTLYLNLWIIFKLVDMNVLSSSKPSERLSYKVIRGWEDDLFCNICY